MNMITQPFSATSENECRVNPRHSQKFYRLSVGGFFVFGDVTRKVKAAPARSAALAFLSVTVAAALNRTAATISETSIIRMEVNLSNQLTHADNYLSTAAISGYALFPSANPLITKSKFMSPLYNIIVAFGHQRPVMKHQTGALNAASFDHFNNDGEYTGPPINDLLKFTAWLDGCGKPWKFMNVFSHADGRYLRSFTKYNRPDAALVEQCHKGHVYKPWLAKYPANNPHWVSKQQRSGCLAQQAVTAEITTPTPPIRKQRQQREIKPVFVDNEGDAYPDVLQEIYFEEERK